MKSKIVEIEMFEAEDGSLFHDDSACEEYERRLEIEKYLSDNPETAEFIRDNIGYLFGKYFDQSDI